ncbi:hypothetical protein ABK040_006002 [Willaertia magna]
MQEFTTTTPFAKIKPSTIVNTNDNKEEEEINKSTIIDPEIPIKRIKTQQDTFNFRQSKAFLILDNFIKELNESIKSKPLPNLSEHESKASPILLFILKLLDELEQFLGEFPPVAEKGGFTSRFGNLAYRDWFDKLCSESDRMMDQLLDKALEFSKCNVNTSSSNNVKNNENALQEVLDNFKHQEEKSSSTSSLLDVPKEPSSPTSPTYCFYEKKERWHVKELSAYWKDAFGNRTRIDYGTGHEATFCAWMCCLARLNIVTRKDSYYLVGLVFKRYLDLMRKIQLQYKLEPAGSHGVWGLDDYQFLPFIWGSSQLINNPEEITPNDIHNEKIIQSYSDKYMYLSCIQFINKVKKGPFGEHSPILNDISGVPKWFKVNTGLIKMYYDEVLFKYVVIQHFLFGALLPYEPVEQKYSGINTTVSGHSTTDPTVTTFRK